MLKSVIRPTLMLPSSWHKSITLHGLEAIPRAFQEAKVAIWVDSAEEEAGISCSIAMARTKMTTAAQTVTQGADLDIKLVGMGAGKAMTIHLLLRISAVAKRAILPTDAQPIYHLVSQESDLLAFFQLSKGNLAKAGPEGKQPKDQEAAKVKRIQKRSRKRKGKQAKGI